MGSIEAVTASHRLNIYHLGKHPIQQPLYIHIIETHPALHCLFAFHQAVIQVSFVIKMRRLAVFTNSAITRNLRLHFQALAIGIV